MPEMQAGRKREALDAWFSDSEDAVLEGKSDEEPCVLATSIKGLSSA